MNDVLSTHRWTALLLAVLFAAASLLASSAATAQDLPQHSHLMIQGVEVDADGDPVGYRRCVQLANNRKLPHHAHHDNLHDRTAKGAQALERAGHWVIPVFLAEDVDPLLDEDEESWATPWTDCASFDAWWASLG